MIESETVARLADECNCVYLNACLESFDDGDISEAKRHFRFRILKPSFRNTMILESGMNPGLISLLLNRGLSDSTLDYPSLDTVHITEYDTHTLLPSRRSEDVFYNTWSPFGLYEEAIKKAEMAWPLNQDPPIDWERDQHLIVHQHKVGFEVCTQSIIPQWISKNEWRWVKYYGFIITHGEIETISDKLGKHIKCAFVFRTCPEATRSLQKWKKHRAPTYRMMYGYEINNPPDPEPPPADNIGVLIVSKKKKKSLVDWVYDAVQ
jgi:homospermidine synthase